MIKSITGIKPLGATGFKGKRLKELFAISRKFSEMLFIF